MPKFKRRPLPVIHSVAFLSNGLRMLRDLAWPPSAFDGMGVWAQGQACCVVLSIGWMS
ncbi:uncharacterized protein LAESUDRAFT_403260 [Laetiporus sulphureus 93-53]|uniref:Uncharacterized protein n=1 Tax=Laetiporus sulphureus 93-53 TaxID=1314785 RepID=A0A165CCL1_9APHY|nr:uncharacterized protein LAESUDRAFT_403260 [Laetiporus sulphureus 93-53]KZT02567.1 hypothetical protein LAESUDRAFT_403260 [Laetiporus sulphureus 93-53]